MHRKLYLFIYKRKERKDPSFVLNKDDLGFNKFQRNFFFWSFIFSALFFFTFFTTLLEPFFYEYYKFLHKICIYYPSKFKTFILSRTFEQN
jgi:hypothetical protein